MRYRVRSPPYVRCCTTFVPFPVLPPLLCLPYHASKRCALKACGNLADYNQANDLLTRMKEEHLTPDIVHWNHALRASAACARWEEARLRLQGMKVNSQKINKEKLLDAAVLLFVKSSKFTAFVVR